MTHDALVWLRQVHERAEEVANAAATFDPPPWTPALDRDNRPYGNVNASPGGSRAAYLDGALWDDEGTSSLAMEPPTAVYVAENHPGVALARVAAERAILTEHEQVKGEWSYRGRPAANPADPRGCRVCHEHDGIVISGGPCNTVMLLASGWRHQPGWREEWGR